ncbi:MAG: response regulator [Sedimentisphaerales bacterium]|nr:response regulator [Sedimentisphaerales bacterium]
MKYHALVVDDNPDVLDDVKDRLESLGHSCDCVTCLQCARDHLAKNSYSYILLDLEIPVRYGRPSRIANGQNLLREIRAMKGYEHIPIIVMTSHGHDSPDLAIEVLRGNGAIDYVKKPFPDKGHTLEKAVQDALDASGRSRPGANHLSKASKTQPVQAFECGEMVFSEDRVDLCEVKVCGGPECGMIRRILDELRPVNTRGAFVAYSGTELAKRVKCPAGQNGVAGAVREFRKKTAELLLDEARIQCGPRDIIQSGGRGYRFTEKISVRDANDDPVNGDGDPVNDPESPADDPANDPVNGRHDPVTGAATDDGLSDRQRWALGQMRAGKPVRVGDVADQHKCSKVTAKRDLTDLRQRGLIEFTGPPKTGHWRALRGRDGQ